MKPRKVIVTLELKSDASLKELKDAGLWVFEGSTGEFEIHQISAQVVKEEK